MNPEAIRTLFNYNYWASERVWDCIMALTDEQFTQPIDYSTGSIQRHMIHLMSATRRWVKRLADEDIPPHLAFEDYPTRAGAKAQWEVLKVETMAYITALDQSALDGIVKWELPVRSISARNPLWAVLLHVANHATDHRAQVLAMLHHHFGVHTVEQDMIFYLAETAERD